MTSILRDVRDLNSGGTRWIIFICLSALYEYPPEALNLMSPTRTIQFIAPHLYEHWMDQAGAQPHIDTFLGIDWILLNAFLKIQSAETDPPAPNNPVDALTGNIPGTNAVTDTTSWESCLLQEIIQIGLTPIASAFTHPS